MFVDQLGGGRGFAVTIGLSLNVKHHDLVILVDGIQLVTWYLGQS